MSIFLKESVLFGLMGGLGLFLFGMKIMSEGLQKIAGEKMRQILAALTDNRIVVVQSIGVILGASIGTTFIDMLHTLAKIGDHTFNLTKSMLGAK